MNMSIRILIRPTTWITRGSNRCTSVAVVRTVKREHLALTRVNTCHADRILDSVRATIREENFIEMRRCQRGDALGSFAALVICVIWADR
ncbi:unannotated protein [freshwater metagenome]|uniref:Unannotated protein n=1 Tax=freshwater metagenome TaxID=449393 RepID=A0A6J7HDC2_9ZZZZ